MIDGLALPKDYVKWSYAFHFTKSSGLGESLSADRAGRLNRGEKSVKYGFLADYK